MPRDTYAKRFGTVQAVCTDRTTCTVSTVRTKKKYSTYRSCGTVCTDRRVCTVRTILTVRTICTTCTYVLLNILNILEILPHILSVFDRNENYCNKNVAYKKAKTNGD